jgi:hypothetical protein
MVAVVVMMMRAVDADVHGGFRLPRIARLRKRQRAPREPLAAAGGSIAPRS